MAENPIYFVEIASKYRIRKTESYCCLVRKSSVIQKFSQPVRIERRKKQREAKEHTFQVHDLNRIR